LLFFNHTDLSLKLILIHMNSINDIIIMSDASGNISPLCLVEFDESTANNTPPINIRTGNNK